MVRCIGLARIRAGRQWLQERQRSAEATAEAANTAVSLAPGGSYLSDSGTTAHVGTLLQKPFDVGEQGEVGAALYHGDGELSGFAEWEAGERCGADAGLYGLSQAGDVPDVRCDADGAERREYAGRAAGFGLVWERVDVGGRVSVWDGCSECAGADGD